MPNLKQVYIRKWVAENRPDLTADMNRLEEVDAFILTMSIAFEAGRHFQADHPDAELDNPNVY